jgi:uncharacterized protein
MRAIILIITLLAGAPATAQDPIFFTLASGDVNGNYFATARAVCSVVNSAARGQLRCSPEATAGSVYNLDALARSEVDFAIVQSDWLVAARDGTGVFAETGRMPDLRGVLALYDEQVTLVVARDSKISGPKDLIGKRVDLGSPASGRRATATRLLELMAIDTVQFAAVSELPSAAALDELCDGQVEAVILVTGHPDLSVARAIGDCGARIVPFLDDRTANVIAAAGLYSVSFVPEGTYGADSVAVPTYAVTATLVTRQSDGGSDPRVTGMIAALSAANGSLSARLPVLGNLNVSVPWRETLGVPAHRDIAANP